MRFNQLGPVPNAMADALAKPANVCQSKWSSHAPSAPRVTLDDAHTAGAEADGGGDTHYVRACVGEVGATGVPAAQTGAFSGRQLER